MLSISHIIIIFIVALIVFGPEKLPELARNLGKVMTDFRRASMGFRQTLEEHMRELERELEETRKPPAAPEQPALPPAGEPAVPPALAGPPDEDVPHSPEIPGEAQPASVAEGSKPAENTPDGKPSPA
jgi:sec-independent protein translocase protein TatB